MLRSLSEQLVDLLFSNKCRQLQHLFEGGISFINLLRANGSPTQQIVHTLKLPSLDTILFVP